MATKCFLAFLIQKSPCGHMEFFSIFNPKNAKHFLQFLIQKMPSGC